jgi:hypothetical protein
MESNISNENKLLIGYHYYIFDDHTHDTIFIQHCFEVHWKHLLVGGIHPNEHIVWSDGCATQFKSKSTWYHVAK